MLSSLLNRNLKLAVVKEIADEMTREIV